MSENCPICNSKIGFMEKRKTQDGIICDHCATISKSFVTETIEKLKEYWNINNERFSKFSTTNVIKSVLSEVVTVDDNNKLIIFGKLDKKENQPIIFNYNELIDYNFETEGAKTVTKKKGGITRAVVGGVIAGPVGAMVGSGTAKEEIKTTGGIEYLVINFVIPSGNYDVKLSRIPAGLTEFLDKIILDNKTKSNNSFNSNDDNINKIKKYKELLDIGAITEEEFIQKKKELL